MSLSGNRGGLRSRSPRGQCFIEQLIVGTEDVAEVTLLGGEEEGVVKEIHVE